MQTAHVKTADDAIIGPGVSGASVRQGTQESRVAIVSVNNRARSHKTADVTLQFPAPSPSTAVVQLKGHVLLS